MAATIRDKVIDAIDKAVPSHCSGCERDIVFDLDELVGEIIEIIVEELNK